MNTEESLRRIFQSCMVDDIRNSVELDPGLSYSDSLYLYLISIIPECTASKISETLGIAKYAVTVRLNRLEDLGYVTRTRSTADGRVQILTASRGYREEVDGMFVGFDEIEKDIRERFGEDDVAVFEKVLGYIVGNIEKECKRRVCDRSRPIITLLLFGTSVRDACSESVLQNVLRLIAYWDCESFYLEV